MLATSTRRSRRRPSVRIEFTCLYEDLVFSCLYCDHADARTIGVSVPQTTRPQALWNSVPDLPQELRAGLLRPEHDSIRDQYPVKMYESGSSAGVRKMKGIAFAVRRSSSKR